MFVLEVLLVGLGIRHQGLANGTSRFERGHGRLLLIGGRMALSLLELGLLLGGLGLRLDLLMSAGHDDEDRNQ